MSDFTRSYEVVASIPLRQMFVGRDEQLAVIAENLRNAINDVLCDVELPTLRAAGECEDVVVEAWTSYDKTDVQIGFEVCLDEKAFYSRYGYDDRD